MYIGHSAIRMYVMGRRAVTDKATDEEISRMARIVQEGIKAGAMGFSTSRTHTHLTPDGTPVASRVAAWEEIDRIIAAMAELDAGIFQAGPDILSRTDNEAFLERMRHFALAYKRPIMFGLISTLQGEDPASWRTQTKAIADTNAAGGRMFGQGTTRSINAIFSLKSYLPFDVLPAWKKIRSLPLGEQQKRLRDPTVRRELIAAEAAMKPKDNKMQGGGAATTDPRKPDYDNLFALKGVDWDDPTINELARASGKHPVEVMIDLSLENANQIYQQPVVNEQREDVLGRNARDLLRLGRPRRPGDGLLAADPPAALLGGQARRLHSGTGGEEADARQCESVRAEGPRPGQGRLQGRPAALRRRPRAPLPADGRERPARRRAATGAESRRHPRNDRQRRRDPGERRIDRPLRRRGHQGKAGVVGAP
jgi:hypothetical protein